MWQRMYTSSPGAGRAQGQLEGKTPLLSFVLLSLLLIWVAGRICQSLRADSRAAVQDSQGGREISALETRNESVRQQLEGNAGR